MSTISRSLPVKLFVGMLARDPGLFTVCAEDLAREFGPMDFRSPVIPWHHTNYYEKEMGPNLLRQFVFFEKTADPDMLVEVKYRTESLERKHSGQKDGTPHRRINLDPGYLTEAKVVLATAKDFHHRISIGKGVYAEVTLRYRNDTRCFVATENTYADYRADEVRRWFTDARQRLRKALGRSHV